MKIWIVFVALLVCAVCLAGAFGDATALEQKQYYSMGLAGGRRLFGLSDEEEAFCQEEQGGEEEVATFCFDGPTDDEALMRSLGLHDKKDVVSLATAHPAVVFDKPLSPEEVGALIYLLVAFCETKAPVEGRLISVSFVSTQDNLTVCAEVDLHLERIVQKLRIGFLPECARFSIRIPYSVKNSEISADYKKVDLHCREVELPDRLLSYGCAAAFGDGEYRRFFGAAIGNVLKNACFYG